MTTRDKKFHDNTDEVATQNGSRFSIGIDTGGTFTDAVIVDHSSKTVVASAKALTTRGDLAIGVGEALRTVLESPGAATATIGTKDIGLVTVSTTLATNAVVEGHADRVAVVLIGFNDAMAKRTGIEAAFPGSPLLRINGGHHHNGDQRCELDEETLADAIKRLGNDVSAIAVSAVFAVRNDAHERRASELIGQLTNAPVTTSTELSSALDAPRRALTAVLNAQLVGRIAALADAVERSMKALSLSCPLMLVKGDGSRSLAEAVKRRPIETVLSGPAASLIGAGYLTNEPTFLMSDIGGTTTDVAILHNGRPQLTSDGASVGGWRTMVRAIDIQTSGLGGDSDVQINGSTLNLGPERIVPLSLLATRYPWTLDLLKLDLADSQNAGSMHGRFVLLPFGTAPTGLTGTNHHSTKTTKTVEDPTTARILTLLQRGPQSLRELSSSPRAQRTIAALRKQGIVQLAGFTPSDAAHVLGLQATWNRSAAEMGAQMGARFRLMREATAEDATQFAQDVFDETARRSVTTFLSAALDDPTVANSTIATRIACARPTMGLVELSGRLTIPLVGVGGPAPVFYPEAARRLNATLILPEFGSVANAVGAAVGVVSKTVTATVTGDGSGLFRAHVPAATKEFSNADEAIQWAREHATQLAVAAVRAMGASEPETHTSVNRTMIPGSTTDLGLIEATIKVESSGWPDSTL